MNVPPPYIPHLMPPISAPEDSEQRNIIDKLATFVARNGVEFENVTKEKQADNPKFRFLFGGPLYNYYAFKLNSEREAIKFQQQSQTGAANFSQQPPPPSQTSEIISNEITSIAQLALVQTQINTAKEQIAQSEKNLQAQRDVFKIKKKIQVEVTLKAKSDKLTPLLAQSQLDIASLEHITNKIVDTCTKDAIAAGRTFVFNKAFTPLHHEALGCYLMQRILKKETTNEARLHLIYFMNDIIHHGNRKDVKVVKEAIERVIVPSFCTAIHQTDEEKKGKMNKLLELWEKNKYLPETIIQALYTPIESLASYEKSLNDDKDQIAEAINSDFDAQLAQLELQHSEFVNHTSQQITISQNQINMFLQRQKQQQQLQKAASIAAQFKPQPQLPVSTNIQPPNVPPILQQPPPPHISNSQPPVPLMSLMSINPFDQSSKAENTASFSSNESPMLNKPPPNFNIPPPQMLMQIPKPLSTHFQQGAPNSPHHGPVNLSLPPPGFGPMPPMPPSTNSPALVFDQQMPTRDSLSHDMPPPYYALPAGLLVPIVSANPNLYEPIDNKLIKIPAPEIPSEKLLKSIDDFYNPSVEEQRNEDGWRKMGLYDFYHAKLKAIIQKKDELAAKQEALRKESKRNARTRSRSKTENSEHRSKSVSSSSSDSRSSSSSSSSHSRSPKSTRTRKVSVENRERSISPRPFVLAASAPVASTVPLNTLNKGHQLLQKMGWSGSAGLGRNEQGIVEPVRGGEVRERSGQFKGIGVRSDPFEQFRNNKSKGYVQRLRDRDDEERKIRKEQKKAEANATDVQK